MASTYSSNLKIELIGIGEQENTWGTTTNTNLGTTIEQAIVGFGNPEFTNDANLTLTISNANTAQVARNFFLHVTSSVSLSTTRNLIVPDIEKTYVVHNDTTGSQSIVVKTSAGTGVTVPTGKKALVYVDGTDVITQFDYSPSLAIGTVSLESPLAVASGGTGGTTSTGTGAVVLASSPTLTTPTMTAPTLGTPASGTLTNCTGLLISNTTGTLAIARGGTGSTSTTYCSLTTNVTGTLPIARGGTGSTSTTYCSLTTNVTGTLPVARGGTGVTSSTGTGNNVLSASPTFTGTITAATITASGVISSSSNITYSSDARLKKDVKRIRWALWKIFRLRGVMFTVVKTEERNSGLIAQNLQKVMPELVHVGDDGMLTIAYANLVGLLIEGIKEAVVLFLALFILALVM